ncbi:hypothetical protein [Methanogenium cariaci]|nr:hypothetical protein [Methanogenium cariaci]
MKEGPELDEVNAVFAIIVGGFPTDPARTIDSGGAFPDLTL